MEWPQRTLLTHHDRPLTPQRWIHRGCPKSGVEGMRQFFPMRLRCSGIVRVSQTTPQVHHPADGRRDSLGSCPRPGAQPSPTENLAFQGETKYRNFCLTVQSLTKDMPYNSGRMSCAAGTKLDRPSRQAGLRTRRRLCGPDYPPASGEGTLRDHPGHMPPAPCALRRQAVAVPERQERTPSPEEFAGGRD